ncbi:hypothetical protein DL766_010096 [Monosporascus sp. MC13-8B]|uniref:Bacterial surface antigen (D15) domain-containing protein n=1 Tax=Monosporascus cannonballus TaxID=155416 RepID=A0ABY0GY36_9PEZI|nr:hypothetical protein DL762_008899 [Monosporascus cannonballus]RYP01671.1 hypothetical protein DL763_000060 [Monosporascus cannonballus]RYP10636.1 hypothetical protein DL766_010096 [Monosporascus sp. MC13-8B]
MASLNPYPRTTPQPRGSGNAKLPGASRHKNSTTTQRNRGGLLGPDEAPTLPGLPPRLWRVRLRSRQLPVEHTDPPAGVRRAPRVRRRRLGRGPQEPGDRDPLRRARGGPRGGAGANSIDDAILMAMSYLTRISIAPGRASVDVCPRLAGVGVYAYLVDFERTAVGGRIAPISAAGLTLGGGIGFQGDARGHRKNADFLQAAADYATYSTNPLSHILPLVEIVNQTTTIDLYRGVQYGGRVRHRAVDQGRDGRHRRGGAAREGGLYDPFVYMGDVARFQDVFAGYGAENRERLLPVSRGYHPDRVFQALLPGGFKIGL